jgi:hypothetical protein
MPGFFALAPPGFATAPLQLGLGLSGCILHCLFRQFRCPCGRVRLALLRWLHLLCLASAVALCRRHLRAPVAVLGNVPRLHLTIVQTVRVHVVVDGCCRSGSGSIHHRSSAQAVLLNILNQAVHLPNTLA